MLKFLNPILGHFKSMFSFAPDNGAGGGAGGGGGAAVPEWVKVMPAEMQADPSVIKYKTAEEFYKGHKSAMELVGRKGVIVPAADAPPEEREKFFNALGRPEKVEGYKLTEVQGLHKSLNITAETSKPFLELAHKTGILPAQADAIHQWYLKSVSDQLAAQEQAQQARVDAAKAALTKEWGQDFNANFSLAKRVVEKIGGPKAVEAFGDLGNNPEVLKFLATVGKSFAEDNVGRFGFSSLNMTPKDAEKKIDEIMHGDKKHPYHDDKNPRHKEAVKEMTDLHKLAYGGGNG